VLQHTEFVVTLKNDPHIISTLRRYIERINLSVPKLITYA